MKKKILLIINIIMLMVTLTSCYDAREVTSANFVQIIGIDHGVTDKWRITVKVPIMQNEGGSSGKGSESSQQTQTKIITIDAPSFHGGINLLNTNIPQRLDFSHAVLLVISEELAQSGLVGEYITPLIRFKEIRRTLNVIVVQGSAEEFVEKTETYTGGSLSWTVTSLLKQGENTGFFPKISMNDFYDGIKSTYRQPVLPLGSVYNKGEFKEDGKPFNMEFNNTGQYFAGDTPRKGGNSIELLGSALFDKDRMVGKLNGHETRMMMLIRGEFKKGIFTIQDPKDSKWVIPIDTRLSRKPDVKIYFDDGRPIINLEIKTEGDILAVQSEINYENEKMLTIIENKMIEYLEDSINSVIDKCQSLKIDAFNFGRSAVMHFLTINEWENYNWNEKFKEAKVEVKVDFKIKRTGGLLKTSDNNVRDE
ncbi:MAG: Ger(x)C family spore germination protein [Actinobacteria bacterium]|nr:Ger(x)C family spore germination protein [Actinomycetota bacterium]